MGAYAAAGVDIAAGERAVELMRAAVHATYTPAVLGGFGAFGALHRAPGGDGAVLVSSTDGVGTKVKIAIALDRHDSIGRDLVHHCIDDILTLGARPCSSSTTWASERWSPRPWPRSSAAWPQPAATMASR